MSTKFLSPGWRMPRNANQSKFSNYSMDFSSQYIDTTDKFDFIHNTKIFSISVWVKMDSYSDNTLGFILGNNYTGSNSQSGFMFWTDNRQNAAGRTEALNFNLWDGTNTTFLNIENIVNDNNWHNYIAVGDETTLKIYKDGTQLSTTASLAGSTSTTAFANFRLGANTYSPPSIYLNGKINDVSIFDYALSPSQVTTLWGGGTSVSNPMALPSPPIAYYPLGGSAAAFRTPVNTSDQWLIENNAIGDYVFDFTPNDYIDLGSADYTEGITTMSISGWFNPNFAGSSGAAGIVAKESRDFYVGWYSVPANSIRFLISDDDGATNDSLNSLSLGSNSDVLNKWHHFVCTWDASDKIKIYINGSLSTETNSVNATSALPTSTNILEIGRRETTYFDGAISNIQIFNTVLLGSEVETLYNNGSPIRTLANIPQSSNLKAWYKLDASEVYNSSTTEWSVDNNQNPSAYASSLDFNPSNSNYIDCGDSDDLSFGNDSTDSPFSISAWVNWRSISANNPPFVSKWGSSLKEWLFILNNDGKIRFYLIGGGGNVQKISATTLSSNTWYHVTATYDGSGGSTAYNGMNLYINGVKENATNAGAAYNAMANTSQPVEIGRYQANRYFDGKISNASIWNTALTPAQVTELYNNGTPSNLSSHSVTSNLVSWWKLNNTTTGIEDSKGSNNGTNNGATEYTGFVNKLAGDSLGMSQANLIQSDLQTVAPYSKYAIKFEAAGGNERIEGIGNTLGNGFSELSISSWVNYSASPGNQYWPIIAKSSANGTSFSIQNMRSGASSNGGELYFNVQTPNGSFSVFSGVIPSTNVWYNITGTYDGNEVKIYINNVLKGTLSATGAINTNNSQVYIGDSGYGGYSAMFKGIMSNISVWNTGLTSSQVTEIYNQGLPSNLNSHSAYSNLVSWWQLGENSSFDGNDWLFADEKGSNNGESVNMTSSDLVNGVGTTANGVSSGMSEGNLVGDAPYSTANAISTNMVVTSRVTGSGNTP